MKIELSLHGAFRDWHPEPILHMELPPLSRVADLRRHLQMYWAHRSRGLLAVSAFADGSALLRDADALPEDGLMAILPPVSGG